MMILNPQYTIETDVDRLKSLVDEKGELSFKDAALKLKVSPDVITEWALILEDKGVLHIDYSFLSSYMVSRKRKTSLKASLQIEKGKAVNEPKEFPKIYGKSRKLSNAMLGVARLQLWILNAFTGGNGIKTASQRQKGKARIRSVSAKVVAEKAKKISQHDNGPHLIHDLTKAGVSDFRASQTKIGDFSV
ncbi:hypothetical protein J4227_04635 [Candidatus Woesearchaeota archaeon]|nr:hypothetical protein [Candidatus Woesearchaeota archaeon]